MPVVVIDLIIPHLRNNAVIIEVGCGNGGKLERLCQINREALGIGLDLSASSLRCAKSKSQLLFIKSTGESLPLEDNVADITVSMYALEHLTNPEQVISEMLRITKKDGVLLFLAPNYGSPIFPSPCNKKNIIRRFIFAMSLYLARSSDLNWASVTPRLNEPWQSDFDCVAEPFLPSLKRFLANRDVDIIISKTIWPQNISGKSVPFWKAVKGFWGPQLLVLGKKGKN